MLNNGSQSSESSDNCLVLGEFYQKQDSLDQADEIYHDFFYKAKSKESRIAVMAAWESLAKKYANKKNFIKADKIYKHITIFYQMRENFKGNEKICQQALENRIKIANQLCSSEPDQALLIYQDILKIFNKVRKAWNQNWRYNQEFRFTDEEELPLLYEKYKWNEPFELQCYQGQIHIARQYIENDSFRNDNTVAKARDICEKTRDVYRHYFHDDVVSRVPLEIKNLRDAGVEILFDIISFYNKNNRTQDAYDVCGYFFSKYINIGPYVYKTGSKNQDYIMFWSRYLESLVDIVTLDINDDQRQNFEQAWKICDHINNILDYSELNQKIKTKFRKIQFKQKEQIIKRYAELKMWGIANKLCKELYSEQDLQKKLLNLPADKIRIKGSEILAIIGELGKRRARMILKYPALSH